MKSIIEFFRRDDIGEPPWEYDFLYNLPENEYPKYLTKIFKYRTGEKLPLKWDFKNQAWVIDKNRCRTFNQKIQYLKLYGVTDLMRDCTDKVEVRDYVKEKIGEEYLKPVLQIIGNCSPSTSGRGRGEGIPLAENDVSTYFDQINWEKLPNAFVIKCNHGCKWQYIIKDKEQFLNTPQLFEIVKRNMIGWLEQDYSFWCGFEMQYATSRRVKSPDSISGARTRLCEGKVNDRTESEVNYLPERQGCQEKGIKPKILIEPLMREEINTPVREIEVYCFNGKPKIFVNVRYASHREISYYDENFNQIDLILHPDKNNLVIYEKADDYINQTFDLSVKLCTNTTRLAKDEITTDDSRINDNIERLQDNKLSKKFNFVRCDYLVFNNKLYFNELTFTPYSGLIRFEKKWNLKLGNLIKLERLSI